MVKRKAVVPATLGEDRLDGLRTVLWGSTSRVGSALGSSSERHGGTFPFGKDPAGAIPRQVSGGFRGCTAGSKIATAALP